MTINGQEIPSPMTPIQKGYIEIGIIERMASARMVTELKAMKVQHTITYKGLRAASFAIFKVPYLSGETVAYVDDEENEYQMKIRALKYSTVRINPDHKQNVTVVLEEV